MLSERDIEAAHPDAFDFVFGNLPAAKRAEFNRHLTGCRYCQAVVEEYSEIGGLIKQLPPHVEPPAELEDRIVGAMVAALAGQRAESEPEPQSDAADQGATRAYPIPQPSAVPETQVQPRPQPGPPPEPQARPVVTRLPAWRRHPSRFAAIAAVAAAILVAAIVVPLSLGRGPAGVTVVIPLHATTAAKKVFGAGAASGQATARQAGDSWTFELSVHGLKPLPGNDVYVCWWTAPGSTKAHPEVVTGGSFVVGDSGSASLTMTAGVDPRQFRTMEITVESPGDGALQGPVLLTGQA